MRPIDADALKKHYAWWDDDKQKLFDSIVDQQPTVDAEPVKHGKWLKAYGDHEAFGIRPFYRYCSCCNESTVFPYNYCPNCGARMDEE